MSFLRSQYDPGQSLETLYSRPWVVSFLDAHGIEKQWRTLIATFINKTFGPESFVFEASTRTLIVDLYKEKQGDWSLVSKIITRIQTFEFMSLHLLDAVNPHSTFLLSPAAVLNAINDDDSILVVRDYFIRAGLSRDFSTNESTVETLKAFDQLKESA
ncbi:hypothetical protein SARC_08528, partial [Sphaeroforma arctica JP610]